MHRLIEAPVSALPSRDQLTHQEWSGGLSVPQFLERESRLRNHFWAKASMKTWFLIDESSNVLSSCESFRQRSEWDARDLGHTYAVASVFTEKKLRGKGYATKMIDHLIVELKKRDPQAQAVILFSDVGPKIYERSGFKPIPAWDRVISVPNKIKKSGPCSEISRGELAHSGFHGMVNAGEFFVYPSGAQMDWRIERQNIYTEKLGFAQPRICGAWTKSSEAYWVALLSALKVMHFQAQTAEEAEVLISEMCQQATAVGLKKIVIWETPDFVNWEGLSLPSLREKRKDSLPMIYSYLNEITPERWQRISNALWV